MFAVQDLSAMMMGQPSAPQPGGQLVVGLRQVKRVAAGTYLFMAVKVLFKLIEYFQ